MLRTTRQGTGPPLVLCHGGPGLWDYLEPVADMVDDLAIVYRYDQRACGRSSGEPPFDVASAVADLEALRRHWRLDSWTVGGHSWGASLALAYALEHPDRTAGLIYLSGTGVDPVWHSEYHANQAALLTPDERLRLDELKGEIFYASGEERRALDRELCEIVWSTDFGDRSRARELARSLWRDDVQINHRVNRELGEDARRVFESESLRQRLAQLQVPALVAHGEADPRPLWIAADLATRLPRAHFVPLAGVGHFPWLEQPDLLRRTLRVFLTAES